MTQTVPRTHQTFVLPASVVSKLDVSRLVREVERIDAELTAVAVRAKAGVQTATQVTASQQLTDFLRVNGLSVTQDGQARAALVKELQLLKDSVPVVHMTFAVEADTASLGRLADWLRTSVHPQAVISVGLQPSLVAGVYMRLPNKVLDLSLRGALAGSHDALVQELEAYRAGR